MNHLKIYESIINTAKQQNRKKGKLVYYENHHIIPKSLKGSDDKNNLVLLSAKEHFICHKLLTFIYPNNSAMECALHFMIYGAKNKDGVNVSANDYKLARELSIGNKNPFYGRTHSKEVKELLSELAKQRIGKKNHNFGNKLSTEAKAKISLANKGKHISDEQRKLTSDKLKGRHFSEEHKQKISNSKIGKKRPTRICKYCNTEMAVGNFERYHNKNCKYKK